MMTLVAPRFARRLLAVLVLGLGGACATQQIHDPGAADVAAATERWPGTTVADLQHGRSLYASHCSSCHALYRPEAYSADKWRGFVTEMIGRAKLAPTEADDVIRYLVVAAELGTTPPRPVASNAFRPSTN